MKEITEWFKEKGRKLPWRETQDPYQIWVSEVILQQTRVAQGISYFYRFMEKFPTIFDLAAATEDDVLKMWEGLGYYSRARNLHFTAKHIANELNGKFPETLEGLLKLKGIGEYTARAIGSFAFGFKEAVVDGNVYRVLSRLNDDSTPIDSQNGKKQFQIAANELLGESNSAIFNHTMMDLGAIICLPENPKCNECPLISFCLAYKNQTYKDRPVKSKKLNRSTQFAVFYKISNENNEFIIEKKPNGFWKNLWTFPFTTSEEKNSWDKVDSKIIIKHVFTHFDLFIKVVLINFDFNEVKDIETSGYEETNEKKWISNEQIEEFTFPKAMHKVFKDLITSDSRLF